MKAASFFCAWLLVFGTGCLAEDAKPAQTAILLVARAGLHDPNFKDSVVLVTNNLGAGPAGLIINRPTRIAVARLFPDIEALAALGDKVYFGGPVAVGSVWFLFRAASPPKHATQVLEGTYISADVELLRTLLHRDKPMEGLRIFMGISGWTPGQLEAEIARGDWKLERAKPDRVFSRQHEHPWPEREHPEAPESMS